MSTDRYESLHKLTAAQLSALDVLDGGGTHTEAAEVAGVHRVTVTRWVNHHPEMRAELTRRRIERVEVLADRAEVLTLAAFDVIAKAIEKGDRSTALGWLRLSGVSAVVEAQRKRTATEPRTSGDIIDTEAARRGLAGPDVLATMYRDEVAGEMLDHLSR